MVSVDEKEAWLKIKEKTRRTGHTLIGTPKAYPTSEFVVVASNGDHALLRLGSRLATVVSE